MFKTLFSLPCVHCKTMCSRRRPRKLCYTCYQSLEIRALYPSTSKYCRKEDDFYGRSAPPPFATDAIPGSPEKIAILMERARARQQLHHPRDAQHQPRARAGSHELDAMTYFHVCLPGD